MTCLTVPPDTIINVTFTFLDDRNSFRQYSFPISKQGEPAQPQPGAAISQSWAAAQLVRIYADEGPISFFAVTANQQEAQGGCLVNISGHMISVR